MRILYLVDDVEAQTGVTQKVQQNAKQWVDFGHEVFFISLKKLRVFDQKMNLVFEKKTYNFGAGRLKTAMALLNSSFWLSQLVKQVNPDLIYTRYLMYTPFINKTMKNYKVVMEINGDDLIEYKLKSRMTDLYNRWTRGFLLKYVDGFICVSNELERKFSYLGKSSVVIANGIGVEQFELKIPNNNKPILVFIISSRQSWHGLEKVIKMSEIFPEFEFYIIGVSGEDRKNLKYFGQLSQDESTKIIQQCDIGIGSLSLYNAGLKEASPLKTRQYMACGLPVIFAYQDTDINDDYPFCLRLENTQNNIEYDSVRAFVLSVFNEDQVRSMARKYAENFLSYHIKENKRLNFFKGVIDEG